ncbi:MAG TPA: hypothetical protein VJR95_13160 [Rhodanobacter sp.]|nr:hypothetical protein [Rhodanobacter sp.]
MCPICMSAAAIALAGTGSASGLATLVAAKLHRRRRADVASRAAKPMSKIDLQPRKAGGKP